MSIQPSRLATSSSSESAYLCQWRCFLLQHIWRHCDHIMNCGNTVCQNNTRGALVAELQRLKPEPEMIDEDMQGCDYVLVFKTTTASSNGHRVSACPRLSNAQASENVELVMRMGTSASPLVCSRNVNLLWHSHRLVMAAYGQTAVKQFIFKALDPISQSLAVFESLSSFNLRS